LATQKLQLQREKSVIGNAGAQEIIETIRASMAVRMSGIVRESNNFLKKQTIIKREYKAEQIIEEGRESDDEDTVVLGTERQSELFTGIVEKRKEQIERIGSAIKQNLLRQTKLRQTALGFNFGR
jgi:uncharacterized protein YllA (UPF0747 family)